MLEVGFGGEDSDCDISLGSANSSSMSSESCSSSYGRLSFEPPTTSSTENDIKTSRNNETITKSLSTKPHRSSDSAYSAIPGCEELTFRDFRLVRRVGSGDIGTVYLCRLKSSGGEENDEFCNPKSMYAMKVVDKEALAAKKKVQRAEMERKVLKMVDHPFLPTLYAEFEASNFSCFVMEFCSGGDLHSLRHRYPNKRFSPNSARFYAAEVLVALEYLHMLGIIYRDLKPENVLVRSDGHIMLSDFDLCLCSDSIANVESPDSPVIPPTNSPAKFRSGSVKSALSCFGIPNRLFRSRRVQNSTAASRLFVAEPVDARSCSFVGTHEYVSPEVAAGGSHGSAVDWWAFGVFLYEMIYGRTPFAAHSNGETLANIVKKPLMFPTHAPSSTLEHHARGLISGLLEKDPARRLGSKRGSAEVKSHAFFRSLNFALIRSSTPPQIPGLRRVRTTGATRPFDMF